jgi:phosphoribosylformimino-5-aminoimidazole carboxamide ribotide isomerase
MELIPAIDIRNGRCVRLLHGDFDKETVYDANPIDLAQSYHSVGAGWLHVVDLDGAKCGRPVNLGLIRTMTEKSGMKVQLGGGIRDAESLRLALDVAHRVVLGSLAVSQPELVKEWIRAYGAERFTLGFDVRIDDHEVPRLTTHGWTKESDLSIDRAIESFEPVGIRHVLCTDVSRDGALTGPNDELYARCVAQWPRIAFQASGGVRHRGDLESLAALGVSAAISGKALLEGTLTTEEARPFLPGA